MSNPIISQDLFPGSYIEPKWSRIDLIRNAPYYVLRLLLTDKVTFSPRGRSDYVSIMLDGKEYIIEAGNFAEIEKLVNVVREGFLGAKGYPEFCMGAMLRHNPDLLLDTHLFTASYALKDLDIPLDKTRMFWLMPDPGASGYHRSRLPAVHQDKLPDFYTEHHDGISHMSAQWFDAFSMHRAPTGEQLSLYQTMHNANKTLMYECDDDLFNVPSWNPASQAYDSTRLARAKAAVSMAHVIACSTERLCEISPSPDITFHAPNLIDCSGLESLPCSRTIDESIVGYTPIRRGKQIVFVSKSGPDLMKLPEDFNQIKILWTGSSTHEGDLKQLIDPIKYLGKMYGIAIRFVFFGYCSPEFLRVYAEAGNTNPQLVIRDEYSHFMEYIDVVKYHQYQQVINSINPDFSLCPLVPGDFNLAKSNLKVLELGSVGVPSIVSDYGPYRFINNLEDGMKVYPEDKSGWIKAIEHMINNVADRQRMGSNMRERVWEEFSWNTDSENRRKWDMLFGAIHNIVQAKRQELSIDTESEAVA